MPGTPPDLHARLMNSDVESRLGGYADVPFKRGAIINIAVLMRPSTAVTKWINPV